MKWADAIDALLARVRSDSGLISALGGARVYRAGSHRKPEIPSVEYSVVVSTLEEAMEPVLTQWDIFAYDVDTALAVETRLRKLLHWTGWKDVGGVSLSSVYDSALDHEDPEPGVIHRSLDFRHTPVRNRGW